MDQGYPLPPCANRRRNIDPQTTERYVARVPSYAAKRPSDFFHAAADEAGDDEHLAGVNR